tara:strand:- start:1224 stop:1667 length:444 start_codon:yes stop_codon:yes gene_type:complete
MNSSPKDLIKQNSFDMIKDNGNQLIETNEFFKDLSDIMEDEKFSNFFKKYFFNSSESKITIIYMTLYDEFKNKWKELNDSELDKRINIFLLWKIMKNKDTNKFAIQTVLKKLENPSNSIFDELKEFIEFSDKSLKLPDKFSPQDTKK